MSDALRPTREDLASAIAATGINPGDTVYVAASLAALGMLDRPEEGVLSAIWDVVGDAGTVVMPAFNFDFCAGKAFDPSKAESRAGALSEWFRLQPSSRRSWAPPFHSVLAAGRDAALYADAESASSFGPSSAFQRLVEADARHLLVGCGFHEGVAHVHWLEERMEVPYRYWKKFEGDVVRDGRGARYGFFMYARAENIRLDAGPLGERFAATGSVRESVAGLCRFRGFGLGEFAEFGRAEFARNPTLLVTDGFEAPRSPILGLDHVGVVSQYADRIERFLEQAGLPLVFEGVVRDLDLNCRYFDAVNCAVEIVDPLSNDSAVSAHSRKHPDAPLHHIAFRVSDLEAGIAYFAERGYAPIDGLTHLAPRPSDRVCFLSPLFTGGLLIELVAGGADPRLIPDQRWNRNS